MNTKSYENFKPNERIETMITPSSVSNRIAKEDMSIISITKVLDGIFKEHHLTSKSPKKNMLIFAPHRNITRVSKIIDMNKNITGLEVYLIAGELDNSKYLEHSFILPKVYESENTIVYRNWVNVMIVENKNSDNSLEAGISESTITYKNIQELANL
ncbi:hypothetical protein V6O07_02435 [Arthrospira platensis SPKY2]